MTDQNKNLNDDLELGMDLSGLKNDGQADQNNATDKPAAEAFNQKKSKPEEANLVIAKAKVILMKKLLQNIKDNNDRVISLMSDLLGGEEQAAIGISQLSDEKAAEESAVPADVTIIEGVFDGESMIGPDGKQYSVPANYASKSKLVEGDILKLTITSKGAFIYKQIGPIERARLVGKLDRLPNGEFVALYDNKKWRLLTASVTYYKGESGDEVVILVPKNSESTWAAVENIVRITE